MMRSDRREGKRYCVPSNKRHGATGMSLFNIANNKDVMIYYVTPCHFYRLLEGTLLALLLSFYLHCLLDIK